MFLVCTLLAGNILLAVLILLQGADNKTPEGLYSPIPFLALFEVKL